MDLKYTTTVNGNEYTIKVSDIAVVYTATNSKKICVLNDADVMKKVRDGLRKVEDAASKKSGDDEFSAAANKDTAKKELKQLISTAIQNDLKRYEAKAEDTKSEKSSGKRNVQPPPPPPPRRPTPEQIVASQQNAKEKFIPPTEMPTDPPPPRVEKVDDKARVEQARLEAEQEQARLEAEQEQARLEAEQEQARLKAEQEQADMQKNDQDVVLEDVDSDTESMTSESSVDSLKQSNDRLRDTPISEEIEEELKEMDSSDVPDSGLMKSLKGMNESRRKFFSPTDEEKSASKQKTDKKKAEKAEGKLRHGIEVMIPNEIIATKGMGDSMFYAMYVPGIGVESVQVEGITVEVDKLSQKQREEIKQSIVERLYERYNTPEQGEIPPIDITDPNIRADLLAQMEQIKASGDTNNRALLEGKGPVEQLGDFFAKSAKSPWEKSFKDELNGVAPKEMRDALLNRKVPHPHDVDSAGNPKLIKLREIPDLIKHDIDRLENRKKGLEKIPSDKNKVEIAEIQSNIDELTPIEKDVRFIVETAEDPRISSAKWLDRLQSTMRGLAGTVTLGLSETSRETKWKLGAAAAAAGVGYGFYESFTTPAGQAFWSTMNPANWGWSAAHPSNTGATQFFNSMSPQATGATHFFHQTLPHFFTSTIPSWGPQIAGLFVGVSGPWAIATVSIIGVLAITYAADRMFNEGKLLKAYKEHGIVRPAINQIVAGWKVTKGFMTYLKNGAVSQAKAFDRMQAKRRMLSKGRLSYNQYGKDKNIDPKDAKNLAEKLENALVLSEIAEELADSDGNDFNPNHLRKIIQLRVRGEILAEGETSKYAHFLEGDASNRIAYGEQYIRPKMEAKAQEMLEQEQDRIYKLGGEREQLDFTEKSALQQLEELSVEGFQGLQSDIDKAQDELVESVRGQYEKGEEHHMSNKAHQYALTILDDGQKAKKLIQRQVNRAVRSARSNKAIAAGALSEAKKEVVVLEREHAALLDTLTGDKTEEESNAISKKLDKLSDKITVAERLVIKLEKEAAAKRPKEVARLLESARKDEADLIEQWDALGGTLLDLEEGLEKDSTIEELKQLEARRDKVQVYISQLEIEQAELKQAEPEAQTQASAGSSYYESFKRIFQSDRDKVKAEVNRIEGELIKNELESSVLRILKAEQRTLLLRLDALGEYKFLYDKEGEPSYEDAVVLRKEMIQQAAEDLDELQTFAEDEEPEVTQERATLKEAFEALRTNLEVILRQQAKQEPEQEKEEQDQDDLSVVSSTSSDSQLGNDESEPKQSYVQWAREGFSNWMASWSKKSEQEEELTTNSTWLNTSYSESSERPVTHRGDTIWLDDETSVRSDMMDDSTVQQEPVPEKKEGLGDMFRSFMGWKKQHQDLRQSTEEKEYSEALDNRVHYKVKWETESTNKAQNKQAYSITSDQLKDAAKKLEPEQRQEVFAQKMEAAVKAEIEAKELFKDLDNPTDEERQAAQSKVDRAGQFIAALELDNPSESPDHQVDDSLSL